jgi:hypothetical protein
MTLISSIMLAIILSSIFTYISYIYNNKDSIENNDEIVKNSYQIFFASTAILSIVFVMINNSNSDIRGGEIELEKALSYVDTNVAPF